MQGSRTLAEDKIKERLKLPLDNQLFDFIGKLQVGDKKNMDIVAKLISERKTENGEMIYRIKIIDATLNKIARLE